MSGRISRWCTHRVVLKFVLTKPRGALALYSPFVAERDLLGSNMKTIRAMGAGAGGEIAGRVGRVSELKIGKFRISNPITMFSQGKKGAFASSALLSCIGMRHMALASEK